MMRHFVLCQYFVAFSCLWFASDARRSFVFLLHRLNTAVQSVYGPSTLHHYDEMWCDATELCHVLGCVTTFCLYQL